MGSGGNVQMHFINFMGRNRVGKSTMADNLFKLLLRRNKCKIAKVSFADPLRYELVEHYGLSEDIIFQRTQDKNGVLINLSEHQCSSQVISLWKEFITSREITDTITLRELFIIHGTHIRRAISNDYWITKFDENARKTKADIIITDDIRYENEFNYTKDRSLSFWLTNDLVSESDHAQDSICKIYDQYSDLITPINVKVPLLNYEAECILRERIIPQAIQLKGCRSEKSNTRSIVRPW